MKKLFKHEVKIYKHPGGIHNNTFEIKEVEVIAENDSYIVINDWYFTKLGKSNKSYSNEVLEKEYIQVRNDNHILGDGVFYTLYSISKIRPSTIKNHIEKKISDHYGWLMNSLDLSIIK
jgi:hypothetical protein